MLELKKARHKVLSKWTVALFLLAVLMIFAGTVTAEALANSNTQNAATPDVRLIAGPDSSNSITSFPSANVNIAPTHDNAEISFSLFPSEDNTLQPSTYYTNLLQIQNRGTSNFTIKDIKISDIKGESNLGRITIYLFAAQTDSPSTGNPIGSISLTSSSSGTINLLSSTYTLPASAINYIEIVGYAAPQASIGSTVGFTLTIQT